jgi:hypothetical protein
LFGVRELAGCEVSMTCSATASGSKTLARSGAVRAMLLLAVAALSGCGLSDGVSGLLVDPARYSAYHCKELIAESQNLANREKKLRDLMDKASEGGGGTVIGTIAYRGDYETVLEQQKLLKRAAAEQKCELVPTYSSDHTVR